MTTTQVLICQRAVTSDGVLDDAVLTIRDGVIAAINPADDRLAPPGEAESVPGWTVPGFVDTHVHGGGGADYATLDPARARTARAFHRRNGTTTSLASLVTTSLDRMSAELTALVPLVAAGEFAGIHLEGPFLSTAKPGAHEPSLLQTPDPASVDRLLEAGQGRIAMVTLAPELPGGLAAIQRLVDAGVVVAVGHTDADEQMIRRALDAGASVATHLFNAMRPIHHREPGPVPLLLDDDRVAVELICDGFHLHADVITLAVNAAGPDRVSLITDAMLAAGAADGDYLLGELPVRVADGMARLVRPDGQPGSIAGSTLTMARAFAFVVGAGIPIPAAAAMAATTPARRHGLSSVGELRVGARADLCVVDDHGVLSRVMQAGGWVSEPPVNQPS